MVNTILFINGYTTDETNIQSCSAIYPLRIKQLLPKHEPKIQKSVWAECIEGCAEFCRITYDLFDSESVIVISERQTTHRHNNFTQEDQNLESMMKQFQDFCPSSQASLERGLMACFESASQISKNDRSENKIRLICISPDLFNKERVWVQGQQKISNLQTYVNELLSRENQKFSNSMISRCEFVLITFSEAVSNGSSIESYLKELNEPQTEESHFFSFRTLAVNPALLSYLMAQICCLYLPVYRVAVGGIPVKNSRSDPSSISLQLLYSFPHSQTKLRKIGKLPLDEKRSFQSNSRVLELIWKTIEKGDIVQSLPTKCIHKITPLDITSNESLALIKHCLIEDKPIALMEKNSQTKFFSHIILSHNKDLYLHCIHQTSFSLLQEDSITNQKPKKSKANSRVSDFSHLIYSNMIQFGETSNLSDLVSIRSGFVSPKELEFQTRFFPVHEAATILYSGNQTEDLKTLMDPIKTHFLRNELSDSDKEICRGYIRRYHRSFVLNEARLFPSDCPENERAESYKRLSQELLDFFQAYALTNTHQEILKSTQQLFSSLLKRGQEQNDDDNVNSSTILRQAYLYQTPNNNNNTDSTKDLWEEAEMAEMENEKIAWHKADESQKPAFEATQNAQFSSELKRARLEEDLYHSDTASLFFQYWSKNLNFGKKFDGWK